MQRSLHGPLVLAASILLIGCNRNRSDDFLGSSIVEVTTYQVATTIQGPVIDVRTDEGLVVKAGDTLALIDTVPLHLKSLELRAAAMQLDATIAAGNADLGAVRSDESGLEREYNRASGLAEKGAVPSQQRDELGTRRESARMRVSAGRLRVRALQAQRESIEAQAAVLQDQLRRCSILAPASGTVLTRYRTVGEVVGPAQPLFEVGRTDTVQADFFVPQPLLSTLQTSQSVRLRIDSPGDPVFVPARVTWISNEAEFSPKNIQTRESRNELVFRVRVRAANPEGILKRGLPVEVWR